MKRVIIIILTSLYVANFCEELSVTIDSKIEDDILYTIIEDNLFRNINNDLQKAINKLFTCLKLSRLFSNQYETRLLLSMFTSFKTVSEKKYQAYKEVKRVSRLDIEFKKFQNDSLFKLDKLLQEVIDKNFQIKKLSAFNTTSRIIELRTNSIEIPENSQEAFILLREYLVNEENVELADIEKPSQKIKKLYEKHRRFRRARNRNFKIWAPSNSSEAPAIETRRVFNNAQVTTKKYPFVASVHVKSQFVCTGTIISRDMILTAASCLHSLHYNPRYLEVYPPIMTVRVGSDYPERDGDLIEASNFFVHPDFNQDALKNNIALIKIKKHLHLRSKNKRIRRIGYQHVKSKLPDSVKEVIILGWGDEDDPTSFEKRKKDSLSFAKLEVMDNIGNCIHIYTDKYVTETNFCAGMSTSGAGACQRDIGGPAIVGSSLVGVVSFGPLICGTPNAPTVFTNVGFYSEWIDSIAKPKPNDTVSTITASILSALTTESALPTPLTTVNVRSHPPLLSKLAIQKDSTLHKDLRMPDILELRDDLPKRHGLPLLEESATSEAYPLLEELEMPDNFSTLAEVVKNDDLPLLEEYLKSKDVLNDYDLTTHEGVAKRDFIVPDEIASTEHFVVLNRLRIPISKTLAESTKSTTAATTSLQKTMSKEFQASRHTPLILNPSKVGKKLVTEQFFYPEAIQLLSKAFKELFLRQDQILNMNSSNETQQGTDISDPTTEYPTSQDISLIHNTSNHKIKINLFDSSTKQIINLDDSLDEIKFNNNTSAITLEVIPKRISRKRKTTTKVSEKKVNEEEEPASLSDNYESGGISIECTDSITAVNTQNDENDKKLSTIPTLSLLSTHRTDVNMKLDDQVKKSFVKDKLISMSSMEGLPEISSDFEKQANAFVIENFVKDHLNIMTNEHKYPNLVTNSSNEGNNIGKKINKNKFLNYIKILDQEGTSNDAEIRHKPTTAIIKKDKDILDYDLLMGHARFTHLKTPPLMHTMLYSPEILSHNKNTKYRFLRQTKLNFKPRAASTANHESNVENISRIRPVKKDNITNETLKTYYNIKDSTEKFIKNTLSIKMLQEKIHAKLADINIDDYDTTISYAERRLDEKLKLLNEKEHYIKQLEEHLEKGINSNLRGKIFKHEKLSMYNNDPPIKKGKLHNEIGKNIISSYHSREGTDNKRSAINKNVTFVPKFLKAKYAKPVKTQSKLNEKYNFNRKDDMNRDSVTIRLGTMSVDNLRTSGEYEYKNPEYITLNRQNLNKKGTSLEKLLSYDLRNLRNPKNNMNLEGLDFDYPLPPFENHDANYKNVLYEIMKVVENYPES